MRRAARLLNVRLLPTIVTLILIVAVVIALARPALQVASRHVRSTIAGPEYAGMTLPGAKSAYSPGLLPSETLAASTPNVSAPGGDIAMAGEAGLGGQRSATPPAAAAPVPPIQKKIIYTAEIDLAVIDFRTAVRALETLVTSEGGYMANAETQGTPGNPQFGRWKARVPVDRFEGFLQAVEKLGELQKSTKHGDDVSEEYYDLEARIKNKKVEEARLLKHLEESTAKLKDTLEVERELSRVREEIERQEGRIRLLANLSAMTTVTITMRALTDYTPPTEPTFSATISRTFRDSFGHLVDFGKAVVIAGVAITPWIPVLLLGGVALWLFLRWLVRRLRTVPLASSATQPSA